MPVPGFLTALAIVLLLWGIITLVRRTAETGEPGAQTHQRMDRPMRGGAEDRSRGGAAPRPGHRADDDIDWEELERAEEEVKDLGADATPEDGWEGDDWGPGAPRKPPLF
jgi:hypothetical protein